MPEAALTLVQQKRAIAPPMSMPADATPDQSVEQRYMAAVEALLDDALEHHNVETLVEVLTWHLARIGFGFGTKAVADIMRRLGVHLSAIAEQQNAQQEAEDARKAGRKPQ